MAGAKRRNDEKVKEGGEDEDEDEASSKEDGSKDEEASDEEDGDGSKKPKVATAAKLLHKLLHEPPMYVYCAQFHPTAKAPHLIATGGYDAYVRLWRADNGRCLGKLDRGRKHHKSHINCAVFTKDGNRLITGDGVGRINVWRLETGKNPASPNAWHLARAIDDPDVRGNAASVAIHPKERLFSRHATVTSCDSLSCDDIPKCTADSQVPALDAHSISLSPDGAYVISGSEDGKPRYWHTKSGARPRKNVEA